MSVMKVLKQQNRKIFANNPNLISLVNLGVHGAYSNNERINNLINVLKTLKAPKYQTYIIDHMKCTSIETMEQQEYIFVKNLFSNEESCYFDNTLENFKRLQEYAKILNLLVFFK